MNEIKHYYLHADLDAFFASVEQLDNPEYRGKPLIVGGKPEDKRSVVSTASYEARRFGVHSAMPVAKAYQLCPQGIFVYGRMQRYSELSYQIMNIFKDFSPDVQQMSIDEAFIDLTGTEKLFGPPQETAMKIKERVKTETGLTVSIGLAPTKYLAKLASDMQKPDGFYKIDEGQEEAFMLNLPLKKVWGIGDKTYEALKANGLRSTRDIYEKSLQALIFMYGQNTGNFLYNVVRGIDVVNFDRKAKSHSISNETTFPLDISDTYTAETAILDLCHSVIFRLLKENAFSRTVQVKIRYEDFTTVSIQQTYNKSILTLDSLYSAAKELFERKYERGRGIRLIGIALENIEETERSVQQSLFDDGSEKKQNVEKAILSLEKKHPELKIHKARMLEKLGKGLKTFIAALIISFFCLIKAGGPLNIWCQEQTEKEGTEKEQMHIEGYWKGQLKGSVDSTFGFGNPFALSAQPPLFTQEVDLSALIHISPQFFFSLEFLDEFKNNTYTLGYDGRKYLNMFRFSNRYITFPHEYSSNSAGYGLSGGKNEAPGFMLHFTDYENQKWTGDFMLRYDMTQTRTASFYGKSQVSQKIIKADTYSNYNLFVIPSSVINKIKNVYIQSQRGSYKDNQGRSYEKLAQSDFIIFSSQKLLLLSQEALKNAPKDTLPYIVITFIDSSDVNTLLSDTGSYSDAASYAGKIQEFFNTSSPYPIDLSRYSSLDFDSLSTSISGDNSTGIIIQKPGFFSPYACANIYKITQASEADYSVTDSYSQKTIEDYKIDTLTFPFEEDLYAAVKASGEENQSWLLPQNRYPFADRLPYLYLPDTKGKADTKEKTDYPLFISQLLYSPVKEYDIGKKASAGSVQVYVNGILEPAASYDSNTGFVKLPYDVNELDKIYITYNEESKDISQGSFVTAIGFNYNFLPALKLDLSFTGKYPFTAQKMTASPDKSYQTFSAFTTALTYKGPQLSAYDIAAAAIEDQNTTNIMNTGFNSLSLYTDPAIESSFDFIDSSNEKIKLSWSFTKPAEEISNKEVTLISYFNPSDFSNYKSINFEFALSQAAELTIILQNQSGQKALEIKLNKTLCSALADANITYHTLTLLLQNGSLLLDGLALDQEQYELYLDKACIPYEQKIIISPVKEEGQLSISNASYKDDSSFFTAKNIAGLKFQNQTGFVQLQSVQGLSLTTDSGKKSSDYINSSAKAGINLFGLSLSGQADTSYSSFAKEKSFLNSAGHSLLYQTPHNSLLSLGESYRMTASAAFDKKDFVKVDFQSINFPLMLQAESSAKNTDLSINQDYKFAITSDIKNKDSGLYLAAKLNAGQRLDEKSLEKNNYFSRWYDASALQFSSGYAQAQRKVNFNTTIKGLLPYAKLSPEFTLDFSNTQKARTQGLASSDLLKLSIPFSTANNAFSINLSHKASLEEKITKVTYAEDLKTLFTNQSQYKNLYTLIPYYSLFDQGLYKRLNEQALQADINYLSQQIEYDFSWRRKLFNNIKDLYIPYSASLGASRNIISGGIQSSDLYQLKAALTINFLNLFKEEEYTGSISASYKFSPEDKNASYFVLNSSELMLFYIDNSNTLTAGTEFFIDSNINWSFKSSVNWKRASQKSLLLVLTKALWKDAQQMDFKSSVSDGINLLLARQNKINKQSYEYSRASQISFNTNVAMNSAAGLIFAFEEGKSFKLSLSYRLGIQINF